MDDRTHRALLAVTGAALLIMLLYPAPVWGDGQVQSLISPNSDLGAPATPQHESDRFTQPTHLHAQLFFLIEGERKELGEAYMERERWGHFHRDDGIFHKEAVGVTIEDALASIAVNASQECLTFQLDNETYCSGDDHEIRFNINEESVRLGAALNHSIAQDDTVIVFFGDANTTITEEYLEKQLPDMYRPNYNNL